MGTALTLTQRIRLGASRRRSSREYSSPRATVASQSATTCLRSSGRRMNVYDSTDGSYGALKRSSSSLGGWTATYSSGMKWVTLWLIASAAEQPNMRSAAALNSLMLRSASTTMTASLAVLMMAAS